MLYLHHTATVNGTANQHYSFTGLPSTEKLGEMFGELVAGALPGQEDRHHRAQQPELGSGRRARSRRWRKKYGLNIVAERKVQNNQANYTQELLDMKSAGADLVWVWENALASTQIIKQAKAQAFSPTWLLFPFNLTSQTLGNDALNPPLIGVAMYTAYSYGDYSGQLRGVRRRHEAVRGGVRAVQAGRRHRGARRRLAVPELDGPEGPRGAAAGRAAPTARATASST